MLSRLISLDQRYLFSIKSLYFFLSVHVYALHVFRERFCFAAGVDSSTYGLLVGAISICTFPCSICVSFFVDASGKSRFAILLCLLASTSAFLTLFSEVIRSTFPLFALFFGIYLISLSSVQPIGDTLAVRSLSGKCYGRQRAFGTLGFVAANFLAEKLVGDDLRSFGSYSSFKFLVVITAFLVTLPLFFLRRNGLKRSPISLNAFYRLFSAKISALCFIVLLNGITRTALTNFLTAYQKNFLFSEKNNIFANIPVLSSTPAATAAAFGVIPEVLIFLNSASILSKIGLYSPLLIAQTAQLVRFASYLYMKPSKYTHLLVYSIESLKGVNYGLTHIACQALLKAHAPIECQATAQAVYSGTFTSLAGFISGLSTAFIFRGRKNGSEVALEEYRNLFKCGVGLTAVTMLAIVLYKMFLKDMHDKKTQNEEQRAPGGSIY